MEQSYWTRSALQAAISRRRALAVTGAGAAAAFLAACGGSSNNNGSANKGGSAPTQAATATAAGTPNTRQGNLATSTPAAPAAQQPQRGGTLTAASNVQYGNLNPQEAGGSTVLALTYMYDHLVNSDYQNGLLDLSAAGSLEQPNPTQFVFKLRSESKFLNVPPGNGRNVTSGDVVASWKNFVADPKSTGAKTAISPLLDTLQTPDDQTFIVNIPAPNVWTLGPHGLCAPIPTQILPKEAAGTDLAQKSGIGSGGYLLDQFDPASVLSFKRRPDGWHGDRPYIDNVVVKVITDATARAAALRAKQIDTLIARDKVQADEFVTYGKDLVIDKQLTFPRLLWIRSDVAPFNDDRLRAAIYAGLDIQGLIDKVEVGQGEWSGPVPPYLTEWAMTKNDLKTYFPADLAKAKAMLSAAGWDSTNKVDLKFPQNDTSQNLATILQQQFAAFGLNVNLVPQDAVNVWGAQTIAQKNFTLTCADQYFSGQDPDIWLRYFGTSVGIGPGHPSGWASTPAIEALVHQEQTIADLAQQKPVIAQAQQMMLAGFDPVINLYSPYAFTGRWSYFHPVTNRGYAGVSGLYQWTERKS